MIQPYWQRIQKKGLQILIEFATSNHLTLIPRTAGTSLAGQCVGDGIIVDVSKYFTNILDQDMKEISQTLIKSIHPNGVKKIVDSILKE